MRPICALHKLVYGFWPCSGWSDIADALLKAMSFLAGPILLLPWPQNSQCQTLLPSMMTCHSRMASCRRQCRSRYQNLSLSSMAAWAASLCQCSRVWLQQHRALHQHQVHIPVCNQACA